MAIDLLTPAYKLDLVHIELTTRCNARCIYCHKSYSEEASASVKDFPVTIIPDLVEDLRSCGLRHLRVSGDGETTTNPDWRDICEQFLSAGFNLEIVSNFAKKFSQDELNTLAKFKRILVSCDTMNPTVLGLLRRGVSVEQIKNNLKGLNATCNKLNIPLPNLCLSVVVTDMIVFDLEKTIKDALTLGFDEFFLNDLCPGPDIQGELSVRPIWTLPKNKLLEAQKCLESVIDIAANAGANLVGTPGLLDTIAEVLERDGSTEHTIGKWSSPAPTSSQTRNCLLPWRHAYITVDALVKPCCIPSTPVMGDLKVEPIHRIINNLPYRTFREKLLTGNLPDACTNCALAGIVPVDQLESTVSSMICNLAEIIDSLLPAWQNKRIIIYGAGGHSHKLFAETAISSIPLLGIVDRNPKLHGKTLAGITIYPINAIEELNPEIIIISSLELEDEIYEQLSKYRSNGIEIHRIYRSI